MLAPSLVLKAVKIVAVFGVCAYLAAQVRKPDRFAGRLLAMLMNHSAASPRP